MDKKFRRKVYFNIFRIIIFSIVFIFAFGIYGIIVPIILSAVFYREYKKELDRINAKLPKADERSQIVAGKAAKLTVGVMGFAVLGMYMYSVINRDFDNRIGPELDVISVLAFTLLSLIITMITASFYYDRKGDL